MSGTKEQNATEVVNVNNQLTQQVSQLVQLIQQVKGGQPVFSNLDVSANVDNCASIAPKKPFRNALILN